MSKPTDKNVPLQLLSDLQLMFEEALVADEVEQMARSEAKKNKRLRRVQMQRRMWKEGEEQRNAKLQQWMIDNPNKDDPNDVEASNMDDPNVDDPVEVEEIIENTQIKVEENEGDGLIESLEILEIMENDQIEIIEFDQIKFINVGGNELIDNETPDLRFPCKDCKKTFKHKSNVTRHTFNEHGENTFICVKIEGVGSCEGGLHHRTREALTQHENSRNHKNIKIGEYKCTGECKAKNCKSDFPSKKQLQRHVVRELKKPENGVNCILCGKNYPDKNNLDNHNRSVHLGIKPKKSKKSKKSEK